MSYTVRIRFADHETEAKIQKGVLLKFLLSVEKRKGKVMAVKEA